MDTSAETVRRIVEDVVRETVADPSEARVARVRERLEASQISWDVGIGGLVRELLREIDPTVDMGPDAVPMAGSSPSSTHRAAGERIGPYRIVDELGAGGMAVVYLAERVDGEFEQQVAIKVMQRALVGREVTARFERERQILAGLRHPNLAAVLDGGRMPDGRPYYVLELVDGVPIDEYCDDRRLGVEGRIRLFLQVARAVAHAHSRLIVHRDIKPSNILVTRQATAKLLDFGIAKPLGESEEEGLTRAGLGPLTPAFASPEQLAGATITTASDVYQLGLLLYLLLTGRSPHRTPEGMARASVVAAEDATLASRVVADASRLPPAARGEPPCPEEVAAARSQSVARLQRRLRGDLDVVLATALRREPERRYSSVGRFVDDLVRHLDGRTVSARPDSFGYRAGKLISRNRVAAAVLGILLVSLVAFSAVVTLQARRLADERDRANLEARTAERTLGLLTSAFGQADPSQSLGADVTARQILEAGAARVEEELADEPLVRAEVLSAIARVYDGLGQYERAAELLERARDLLVGRLAEGDARVVTAKFELGGALWRLGREAEAEELLGAAYAARRRAHGPEAPETLEVLANLGNLYHGRGQHARAEEAYAEAYEGYARVLGEDAPRTLDAQNNLSNVLDELGRNADAIAMVEDLVERRRRVQGEDHPQTLGAEANLGVLYRQVGRLDEAQRVLEDVLASRTRILGSEHPDTVMSVNNLAALDLELGRPAEAAERFREVLEQRTRSFGPDHRLTHLARLNLATALEGASGFAASERDYRAARDGLASTLGADHPWTIRAHFALALGLGVSGRREEAEREFEALLPAVDRAVGTQPISASLVLYNLACLAAGSGRRENALDRLEQAVEAGFANEAMFGDPDLDSVRGTDRYRELEERVRVALATAR